MISVSKLKCNCCLFIIGGLLYGLVEIIWRHYTHWSMIITGGLCFVMLYRIFKKITECSLCLKCIIGSIIITFIEFFAGFIFNFRLKLNVWDYSGCLFNFCGQICLIYSFLWGMLTIPVIAICKFLDKKFSL